MSDAHVGRSPSTRTVFQNKLHEVSGPPSRSSGVFLSLGWPIFRHIWTPTTASPPRTRLQRTEGVSLTGTEIPMSIGTSSRAAPPTVVNDYPPLSRSLYVAPPETLCWASTSRQHEEVVLSRQWRGGGSPQIVKRVWSSPANEEDVALRGAALLRLHGGVVVARETLPPWRRSTKQLRRHQAARFSGGWRAPKLLSSSNNLVGSAR